MCDTIRMSVNEGGVGQVCEVGQGGGGPKVVKFWTDVFDG